MRLSLDQLREEFVQAHAGAFINTRQAIEFVEQRLPDLPSTDRAAFAQTLVEESDRRVRWPQGGLSSAQQRERERIVRETLQEFVASVRAETLGVDDLAKALALKTQNPISEIELPAIAVHHDRPAEVVREGAQLAFTGWIPSDGGYRRVQARIDAEVSEGPLTPKEHSAIGSLRATLADALGAELIPDRCFGSIEAVLQRPFDQRRALVNGRYVRAPAGEGKAQHSPDRSCSSFSVGPVFFTVMHSAPSHPFENRLADGSSYRVDAQNKTLQLQIPLGRGEVVYATLAGQDAPASQLAGIIALARRVLEG